MGMQRICVAWLLVLASVNAGAVQLLDLARQDLGIDWSTSAAGLTTRFPGLKPSALRSHVYRGPLELGPFTYADGVVLFSFDEKEHLTSLFTQLADTDPVQLVAVLDRSFGKGRWGTYPDGRVHIQAYDWSVGAHMVEVMYVGVTADRSSKQAGNRGAQLRILERPARTIVDAALDHPKLVQQMQAAMEQAQEQALKKQQDEQEQRKRATEAAPPPPAVINAAGSAALRKANTTWGATLNPGGQASVGMFKVFYINTNDPRTAVASDYSPEIAINYAFDQFHKIPSEDFGAYWVGKLRFAKASDRAINVAHGIGRSRVVVDGQIVHEGSKGASVPFRFTAGDHLVEVEYINDWHTTEFKLSVGDRLVRLDKNQVRGELRRAGALNAPVHYVGVYESKRANLTIDVNVAQVREGAVLLLDSYSAVKWQLANVQQRGIKAIVVASFQAGSEVVGAVDAGTRIVPYAGMIGGYESEASCSCTNGRFACSHSGNLLKTQAQVVELTEGVLASVNGAYAGDAFAVPGTRITSDVIAKTGVLQEQNEAERKRCESDRKRGFEQLMEPR